MPRALDLPYPYYPYLHPCLYPNAFLLSGTPPIFYTALAENIVAVFILTSESKRGLYFRQRPERYLVPPQRYFFVALTLCCFIDPSLHRFVDLLSLCLAYRFEPQYRFCLFFVDVSSTPRPHVLKPFSGRLEIWAGSGGGYHREGRAMGRGCVTPIPHREGLHIFNPAFSVDTVDDIGTNSPNN